MGHVIWDWNGTLFDDFTVVLNAVNASLRAAGGEQIDGHGYRRHYTRPVRLFYEAVLDREIDDPLMDHINDVFYENYGSGLESAGLNTDAREAIRRAADAGATQSVASLAPHDVLVSGITRFGLEEDMLAVDGMRGPLGETKAHHLTHHVQRLRAGYPELNDRRITVIGDIIDDAVAAAAAGVECVLYDGGSHTRADLEAVGVPVASTLLEAVAIALEV